MFVNNYCYQGCFKDGTNRTKDYRCFSFFFRLSIMHYQGAVTALLFGAFVINAIPIHHTAWWYSLTRKSPKLTALSIPL